MPNKNYLTFSLILAVEAITAIGNANEGTDNDEEFHCLAWFRQAAKREEVPVQANN